MSWQTIARQDLSLTVQSTLVKLLLGLLMTVVLMAAYVYPTPVVGAENVTTAHFPGYVVGTLTSLVPFVAMVLSYSAVVGQRESGSIRLSLSLPQSRLDVVLGKFCSRAGLLVAVLAASLVGAGVLVVYPLGELVLLRFLGFILLTALFGLVWSGLGIAASLAVSTRRRALVLGFGLVFLFVIVWGIVENALTEGLTRAGVISGSLPGPVQFLIGLEPGHVFTRVTTGFIVPDASVSGPWYLNEWVSLFLFVAWLVGPLGLAYLRFNGADLS